MATAAEIKTAIGDSAKDGIKSATSDGVTTTMDSLKDRIAAERYLAENTAVDKPHRGLRFTKLRSPGTA